MAMPALFIPHGGGPLPLLGSPCHSALTPFLSRLAARLPARPTGILLVSAHWEEPEEPQLTSSPSPGLLYDYSGFPPAAYELTYPAPGDPCLAQRAADLLRAAGFAPRLNPSRALDHGAFVPLKLAFPSADVPVVQLSLLGSLDAEAHYRMGAALAPLRRQGVLLLGSGMSFHGMAALRQGMGRAPALAPQPGQHTAMAAPLPGQDFNAWLTSAVVQRPSERHASLLRWRQAPGAAAAHPREEHLMPLLVVAGAADGAGDGSDDGNGSGGGGDDAAAATAGIVLWEGECMGAAVCAVAFGTVRPPPRDG